MRRIILEVPKSEFEKYDKGSSLAQIKSYEMVHLLRYDLEGFAAVVKIEFYNRSLTIESIIDQKTRQEVTVQLLESSKEGVKTYFISGKTSLSSEQKNLLTSGGFFSSPFEIRDEKVIMTFIGDSKNLKRVFDLSKKMGIHYNIVSSTDAKFSADSLLNGLTKKQRDVLTVAFENGYYDSPKKISSRELADKLQIKCSTLVEHRRKAEERLIAQVLKHHNP